MVSSGYILGFDSSAAMSASGRRGSQNDELKTAITKHPIAFDFTKRPTSRFRIAPKAVFSNSELYWIPSERRRRQFKRENALEQEESYRAGACRRRHAESGWRPRIEFTISDGGTIMPRDYTGGKAVPERRILPRPLAPQIESKNAPQG